MRRKSLNLSIKCFSAITKVIFRSVPSVVDADFDIVLEALSIAPEHLTNKIAFFPVATDVLATAAAETPHSILTSLTSRSSCIMLSVECKLCNIFALI